MFTHNKDRFFGGCVCLEHALLADAAELLIFNKEIESDLLGPHTESLKSSSSMDSQSPDSSELSNSNIFITVESQTVAPTPLCDRSSTDGSTCLLWVMV